MADLEGADMIDRDIFFSGVRVSLFGNKLNQSQVDGMNYLLDVWEKYFEKPNPRDGNKWLAYCMATVFHETGKAMKPVAENGGKAYGNPPKSYWNKTGPYNQAYYGRGHVQLTWDTNYQLGQNRLRDIYKLSVPIYEKADLMLEDEPSALILYDGMSAGWFTGVGLPKYFNATVDDPVNARKIVNGTDQASTIAGYYQKFKASIITEPEPEPEPVPPPTTRVPIISIFSDTPVVLRLGINVTVESADG